MTPRPGDPTELENAILSVRRSAIDGETADRVTGEILAIDAAPHQLRRALPMLATGAIDAR